jgi:hypothetical protein
VPVPTPRVCPKPSKPEISCDDLPDLSGSVQPGSARFLPNARYTLEDAMYMVERNGIPELGRNERLCIKVRG